MLKFKMKLETRVSLSNKFNTKKLKNVLKKFLELKESSIGKRESKDILNTRKTNMKKPLKD